MPGNACQHIGGVRIRSPSAISQRIRLLEERVGCALVVRAQPCTATEAGRRLCQHVDRVRLLEQELQGALPALAPEGLTRVALPIAVNADSLATWFAPAVAAFAAIHRLVTGGRPARPTPVVDPVESPDAGA